MTRILFYLDEFSHTEWKQGFKDIDPTIEFCSYPDWGTPEDEPAYAFVWMPKPGLLKKYTNLKAIFSLGAGIDHLLVDPDLPSHIPVIRMSDQGLKEGMAEYVVMAVLMHHRKMHEILPAQKNREWLRAISKKPQKVRVGIMGYGALGKVATQALKPFGYSIHTWSRSPKKQEEGLTHYHGADQLADFLAISDIVVGLLPSTAETTNLLNKESMSQLPKGATIINAGRGNLIHLDDLLYMIDRGHIGGAMLDVYPTEPLPSDHPFWDHEKVIVTPHIASITRPDSAARFVLDNIQRLEQGQEPDNKLDTNLRY